MSSQLKAFGKAFFYCKSRSGKVASYHQHTFTAGAFSETCISIDELTSPVLKPSSTRAEYLLVFRTELLT